MLTDKKISVTIPAYNESKTIEKISRDALFFASLLSNKYELVLVNDGSTDRTLEIMKRLKKEFKDKINLIHHPQNLGFSGAIKSCYQHATGDYIFLGPADGQFDYSELKLFIKKIMNNDIVVAYRAINEEKIYRKFYSFFFHLISRVLFGIRLREFSSCILYTRAVRDSITVQAAPFSCLFLPEFIFKSLRKGYKIEQVPIHFYKRKGGTQKATNFKMIAKTLSEMCALWINIKLGRVK